MTSSETASARSPRALRTWVAVLVGIAAGAGTVFSGSVPAVLLVCAVIYVAAAVAGRTAAAWIVFACSLPVIGLGRVLGMPELALGIVAAAGVVLAVTGLVRRTWRTPRHLRQLLALPVFAALAVLAQVSSPLLAGLLAIAGLLAHTAWDLWHHRRDEVVSRTYSAFCAALDLALAVAVAVALVLRGAGW